jgi:starch synthase
MREVTVFVGGSVGSDPYSLKTWSGVSAHLLKGMEEVGLLDKAVGIKVPEFRKNLLLAKNFRPKRSAWRKNFYFDPAYRNSLTEAARGIAVASPVCLQVGSMFNLNAVFPDKECISYHDGNLPQVLASGFGMEGVSRKRIDQALRYEEEISNQMAAIFTFSEYLRKSFISDYHVPPERVFSVGGAVNFTEIPVSTPNKDYSSNRILFIGIEFERKGGPALLQAFRKVREAVPNAELNIVGPSDIGEVPEGVVFHGRLSKGDPEQNAKLESLFRECTFFVLPSLYEPFGIAPLEAMFYQLPCVLTNEWAFPECVTPGVNGDLVAKGSVEDLANKMIAMLSDPERLAVMGAQARARVLSRYTWGAVAQRMSTVIAGL